MDAWERLFRDEQEALNFLLGEEFEMSHAFDYAGFFLTWYQSDKKYGNVEPEQDERWLPVIPVDFILHDVDHPFCYSSLCPCHDEEQEDNKALFLESIEQPIQDGLLTEHEGYCLHWGEIL